MTVSFIVPTIESATAAAFATEGAQAADFANGGSGGLTLGGETAGNVGAGSGAASSSFTSTDAISLTAYVATTIIGMNSQSRVAQAQRDIYRMNAELARDMAEIEANLALNRSKIQGELITNLGAAKAANIEMVSAAQVVTMDIQSDIQLAIAGANEMLALMRAEDSVRRGQERRALQTQTTSKQVGQQRAIFAANGVDVNSGSAAEVQSEQALVGRIDGITIGVNAQREAFGFRNEAINATLAGRLDSNKSQYEAERAQLAGDILPGAIRRDAQGRAEVARTLGEANASFATNRAQVQSLQFNYMSDIFGQRASTGAISTLLTAGIDFATVRGQFS